MRKRKQKKLKAATGPKRATSSFFYYSNEIRPQIKRQHPDMQTAEMAKLMGGKWKELPADEKQKYEEMAAEDKARYEREKAAWDLAHPPAEAPKAKRRYKKRQKRTGPKRATSSFFYFSNEIRPQIKRQHPDMKVAEMGKLIGGKWKELPADQKQKYEDMAAEDMARYRREKAAWRDVNAAPAK